MHAYVFLWSVKMRVFELSRVWPWRWPLGGTPYMEFIGPVFLKTIKNVFDESRTLWLWMSGKRNVSVCSGHKRSVSGTFLFDLFMFSRFHPTISVGTERLSLIVTSFTKMYTLTITTFSTKGKCVRCVSVYLRCSIVQYSCGYRLFLTERLYWRFFFTNKILLGCNTNLMLAYHMLRFSC